VADFGEVVSEARLLKAGWPDRSPSSNNLRVQLVRLRERLESLGLELQSVRGEGLVLQVDPRPVNEPPGRRDRREDHDPTVIHLRARSGAAAGPDWKAGLVLAKQVVRGRHAGTAAT
jgi:DNA-binding winged helix-turn-helix (wHTH) protein